MKKNILTKIKNKIKIKFSKKHISKTLNCEECGTILNNELISYCENCEKYSCIQCSLKHKMHNLVYLKKKGKKLETLDIGVSGAGLMESYQTIYTPINWFDKQNFACEHSQYYFKKGFPVFYDYNGNIFCHECFYKSENNLCDPYILIESKNNVKCLFPFTYESSNINILFTGENRGLRGEKSQFNIFIENNKRNALYELDILIEGYACETMPNNMVYEEFSEINFNKKIITHNIKIDKIKGESSKNINFELKIPLDNELTGDVIIPNNLTLYAVFNYKTISKYVYSFRYIGKHTIKLSV